MIQISLYSSEAQNTLIDQCPLGTAAGFGVPIITIDRAMTAEELGFSRILANPVYAQMSRGKFESSFVFLLTQILYDLNRLASDLILFSSDEFGYVQLPRNICTGSSIMPQKKNPDALELIRGYYHIVVGEHHKLQHLTTNLISGYHRDMQLMKEPVVSSFKKTKACIEIMTYIIRLTDVDEETCKQALTSEVYATEEVYRLVKKGLSFRDAYRQIGKRHS
jgi:argininosuccinate lyase